jgi:predicted nucleic acid-binding protein
MKREIHKREILDSDVSSLNLQRNTEKKMNNQESNEEYGNETETEGIVKSSQITINDVNNIFERKLPTNVVNIQNLID